MNFKSYFKNNPVNLSDKERLAIKVGGLITAARFHSNFSQADLAEKINTKQPSIARAEKGEVIASLEFLSKIAKAVNTELVLYFGFMKNTTKDEIHFMEIKSSQNYQNTVTVSPYVENANTSFVVSLN